jgi:peroxiredoxin
MWRVGTSAAALLAVVCVASVAGAQIAESASEIRPVLIGQTLPEINLKTVDGEPFALHEAVKRKQTVIVIYRGGWCYYCNRQLGQLRLIEKQLGELGYQIIAISPDKPEALQKTRELHKLGVILLSDPDLKAAQALGLAYKFSPADFGSEEIRVRAEAYLKSQGIKIESLPNPGVFLVSNKRTIFFSYVNIDFRVRLSAEVLLTAAKVYSSR